MVNNGQMALDLEAIQAEARQAADLGSRAGVIIETLVAEIERLRAENEWLRATVRMRAEQVLEATLKTLPPDSCATATLARLPVINDPIISEAMAALEDEASDG